MEEMTQHHIETEGVVKKYVVGDLETDLHIHEVIIRDDLPRATTVASYTNDAWPHEHSIRSDGSGGLECMFSGPNYHTHTLFTEVPVK